MNKQVNPLSSELLVLTRTLVELCQETDLTFFETENLCQFPEKPVAALPASAPKKIEPSFTKKAVAKPFEIPVIEAAPVEKPPAPIQSALLEKKSRKDFSTMFTAVAKILPQLTLLPDVPADQLAKTAMLKEKALGKWQVDVLIIFAGASQEDLPFLRSLAKAIDLELAKVKLVDAEKLLEQDMNLLAEKQFSLILALPAFSEHNALRSLYRENPAQKQKFLGSSPLLILNKAANYHKDPLLKKQLWLELCNVLQKNP